MGGVWGGGGWSGTGKHSLRVPAQHRNPHLQVSVAVVAPTRPPVDAAGVLRPPTQAGGAVVRDEHLREGGWGFGGVGP